MGFEVYRVKNERINSELNRVADAIIEKYYGVVDTEDKITKVTMLKAITHHKPIPRRELQSYAIEFNKEFK